MTTPAPIDARGPRFAAGITSVLLIIDVVLGLIGTSTARFSGAAPFGWFAYQPLADDSFAPGSGTWLLPALPLADRVLDPAFLLLILIAALFLWGVLSSRTQPW